MNDHSHSGDNALLGLVQGYVRQLSPALAGSDLAPGTPLLASGLLDSLAILQLMMLVSDELDVEIGDEDFTEEGFETVGSLVAMIARKQAA